jgi:hypothetical protein
MPVEPAIINNPNDKFVFTKPYSIVFKTTAPPMSAECINANPPCQNPGGLPPRTVYFKAGQSIGEEMVRVGSVPMSVLALNPFAVASRGSEIATQSRDAWTGGVEWRQIFNFRNLFWIVLVVYLIYLFLKHMLPLIKKSAKAK